MPRRPRSDLPEVGAYHVASRGSNHGDIYLDDIDRKSFMTILGRVVATHEWKCHAFCLMTTHYHLIVETERSKLSRGMQVLTGATGCSTSVMTGTDTSSGLGTRSS